VGNKGEKERARARMGAQEKERCSLRRRLNPAPVRTVANLTSRSSASSSSKGIATKELTAKIAMIWTPLMAWSRR
jgi:hypothetical protein